MALSISDLAIADGFMLVLAVIFTILRIFTHVRRTPGSVLPQSEGLATILFVSSTLVVIVYFTLSRVDIYRTDKAGDKLFQIGSEQVPYEETPEPNKNHVAQAMLQTLALWLLKGSFLGTFWDASRSLEGHLRTALVFCTIYIICSYLVTLLTDLLYCHPLSTYWELSPGACFSESVFALPPFTTKFAMTLSSDITIMSLGIAILASIKKTQKQASIKAFSLIIFIGSVSIVAGICRYVYNYRLIHSTDSAAITLNAILVPLWTKLELIFATAAYGLTSTRRSIRYLAVKFKSLPSYGSSKTRSTPQVNVARGDSLLLTTNKTWEDQNRLAFRDEGGLAEG